LKTQVPLGFEIACQEIRLTNSTDKLSVQDPVILLHIPVCYSY